MNGSTKAVWIQKWAFERTESKKPCEYHKSQRCLHSSNDKTCLACGDKAWEEFKSGVDE